MSAVLDEDPTEELVRHKPAFIRRVQIRGYKSIAFCDVTLEPLTILVGRNASGKSNFLDALAFLRDLMEMRATEAVHERNGWRAIQCRNSHSPTIEFGLESTFESLGLTWEADYSFALRISPDNQIQVSHEHLLLTDSSGNRTLGYRIEEGNREIEWIGIEHFRNGETSSQQDPIDDPRFLGRRRFDRLLLSLFGTSPFLDLAEGLRASGVYHFSPSAIRLHQPFRAIPILARDGSNLGRAIEGLREIEPESVGRVRQYLSAIVPGVLDFRNQPYGDFETVRFLVSGKKAEPPLEFDASSMSDGTLRALAALIAAFQIVLPHGPPGFVGIEEPETALHPAAMRALVDALDEATLRTQILLTTHSAEMLDNPTVLPENIRVVQMIDGQTIIGPVDEGSVEILRQNLDTLGGLERQNQLEPDLDDQVRQQAILLNGKAAAR